jgi:hypothetical protein
MDYEKIKIKNEFSYGVKMRKRRKILPGLFSTSCCFFFWDIHYYHEDFTTYYYC